MSKHRRKYTREFKVEIVESVLKGRSILELPKKMKYTPDLLPDGKANIWRESSMEHQLLIQSFVS